MPLKPPAIENEEEFGGLFKEWRVTRTFSPAQKLLLECSNTGQQRKQVKGSPFKTDLRCYNPQPENQISLCLVGEAWSLWAENSLSPSSRLGWSPKQMLIKSTVIESTSHRREEGWNPGVRDTPESRWDEMQEVKSNPTLLTLHFQAWGCWQVCTPTTTREEMRWG